MRFTAPLDGKRSHSMETFKKGTVVVATVAINHRSTVGSMGGHICHRSRLFHSSSGRGLKNYCHCHIGLLWTGSLQVASFNWYINRRKQITLTPSNSLSECIYKWIICKFLHSLEETVGLCECGWEWTGRYVYLALLCLDKKKSKSV